MEERMKERSRWRRVARLAGFGLSALLVLGCRPARAETPFVKIERPGETAEPAFKILVFSKTAGFRHDSIGAAVAAIQELGAQNNFAVDASEDAGAFSLANLGQYAAVVFLMTTGDVLGADQQVAFEQYIADGHGFVGVHSASDTEYSWPWYGQLVGAYFKNHPAIQPATITVEDGGHPSTSGLPSPWARTDEWYNFQSNPRGNVRVLLSLDEASYDPGAGAMGDHPIAWCHEFAGGRAWYTGGGHTSDSYAEPAFRQHLLGGIRWAAGAVAAGCAPPGELLPGGYLPALRRSAP
jgi:cytochrome c